MLKFREKLLDSFGLFGFIIYYILLFSTVFFPLEYCHLPFWLTIIIAAFIIFFADVLGLITMSIANLLHIGAWVYSFINIISGQIGVLEIIYFVVFACWLIVFFIPTIIVFFKG